MAAPPVYSEVLSIVQTQVENRGPTAPHSDPDFALIERMLLGFWDECLKASSVAHTLRDEGKHLSQKPGACLHAGVQKLWA